MTLYLDTSVIVSALTIEPETAATQRWLTAVKDEALAISIWVRTEFASALAIKLRTGAITIPQRDDAALSFGAFLADQVELIAIAEEDFEQAERIVSQPAIILRCGDALHVAIARRARATLVTKDRRMYEAAQALGCATRFL